MTQSNNSSSQLDNLTANANIERERKNESKYFLLFTNLIKKKKDDIFKKSTTVDVEGTNSQDYDAEMKTLKKLVKVERDAIIGGFVIGTVAFCSVRLLPRIAIRLIGGDKKFQKLRKSELNTRNSPNAYLKRAGSFLFEGMFGFWAGWRGYHLSASMQTQDIVEDVTNIPLCEGRSVVSDEICHDVMDLVNNRIPFDFWHNLDNNDNVNDDEQLLQNHTTWRNIITFSDNCTKRKAYEDILRTQEGKNDDDIISIPSPGVPHDILDNH